MSRFGCCFLFGVLLFATDSAEADFKVLAIGDTGKGTAQQYEVGAALAKKSKELGTPFNLMLGDNIYSVGISSPNDRQMIDKFEKPYADVPVPFMVALGNHDYGATAREWIRGDFQVSYSKLNPKFVLPSHYYSFEYQDTLFIVLDTSRLYANKDIQAQFDFVRNVIAKNTKKWVIAIGHHPYLSNSGHGNAGSAGAGGNPKKPRAGVQLQNLLEKVLCPYIDVYLSGHDHSLQVLPSTKACPKPLLVVSGTGAEFRVDLKGKNPTYFQKSVLGFTALEFEANRLVVRHLNMNGQTEYSHTLTK